MCSSDLIRIPPSAHCTAGISASLSTHQSLCQDIVRTDFDEMEEVPEIVKVGICYAVTYLYENREKADFDELTRMLKFLLYSVRKEEF